MLLRKLFGLSPPPISQFFDGRALVSRFGCSLRVYYITSIHESHLSNLFILYPLIPLTLCLLFGSYPTKAAPTRGLPFRYQLLSYFKMLYHGLEVSPPTSIDFPFGTHSFSYRRIEPLASSVEASLGGSSPYKRTSHKY